MGPVPASEVLLRWFRLRHRIVESLRIVTATSGAVALVFPSYRVWAVALFGIGLFFEMGRSDTAKAYKKAAQIVRNPNFVYWAKPGTVRFFPFDWQRVILYVRDGNAINVVLGRSRMRSVMRWLCDVNSSVCVGDAYTPDSAHDLLQNSPGNLQGGGGSIEPRDEAEKFDPMTAATRPKPLLDSDLALIQQTLLRSYGRRFQTWRALKNVFVIAAVLLWFVHGYAYWIPAAFAAAVFCQGRWMQIGRSGEAAVRAVVDAVPVYWVQYPAELPVDCWWRCRDLDCAYLHLRDGEKIEVCLRHEDVRTVTAWFIERNPSAPIAAAFSHSLAQGVRDVRQGS